MLIVSVVGWIRKLARRLVLLLLSHHLLLLRGPACVLLRSSLLYIFSSSRCLPCSSSFSLWRDGDRETSFFFSLGYLPTLPYPYLPTCLSGCIFCFLCCCCRASLVLLLILHGMSGWRETWRGEALFVYTLYRLAAVA
ncbi:uncharacterized protein K452DRAFT_66637 [Aplosporella prunicola CBS 121167]|uniref:Uncharacterized protein n=1 Tax=Aplosporella prunicola CBS 121167 TaxID=1176127 RepID=A0A6A6BSW6_9PEZI|nr:uncharacterized protein K452DRAFT_66637 [Aplosporella prunicola CBS 121167]KAF2146503.1 hypothetical protein K452DRAFT_66637 [Aplosporella prunicola CBS 121167]